MGGFGNPLGTLLAPRRGMPMTPPYIGGPAGAKTTKVMQDAYNVLFGKPGVSWIPPTVGSATQAQPPPAAPPMEAPAAPAGGGWRTATPEDYAAGTPPGEPAQAPDQGIMSRLWQGLQDPRTSTYLLGMANRLSQPRQPGTSQFQNIVGSLLSGYQTLSAAQMMQEARKQQMAEMARKAALEQQKANAKTTTAVAAKTTAEARFPIARLETTSREEIAANVLGVAQQRADDLKSSYDQRAKEYADTQVEHLRNEATANELAKARVRAMDANNALTQQKIKVTMLQAQNEAKKLAADKTDLALRLKAVQGAATEAINKSKALTEALVLNPKASMTDIDKSRGQIILDLQKRLGVDLGAGGETPPPPGGTIRRWNPQTSSFDEVSQE